MYLLEERNKKKTQIALMTINYIFVHIDNTHFCKRLVNLRESYIGVKVSRTQQLLKKEKEKKKKHLFFAREACVPFGKKEKNNQRNSYITVSIV